MNIFLQIFMLFLIAVMILSTLTCMIKILDCGSFPGIPLCILIVSILVFAASYNLLKSNLSSEYSSGNSYSNNLKLEYTIKNQIEKHYNEDDLDLEYRITCTIEDISLKISDCISSYDDVRVYITREDDGVKVTYTCTETIKKSTIFTVKIKKAINNTIKVSNENKNNKEYPGKDDVNKETEVDNENEDIELKKE